jgi:hypothetical protein
VLDELAGLEVLEVAAHAPSYGIGRGGVKRAARTGADAGGAAALLVAPALW